MHHIAKSVADVLLLSKDSGGIGASITKLRASVLLWQQLIQLQVAQHHLQRLSIPRFAQSSVEVRKRCALLLHGKLAHRFRRFSKLET